MFHVTHASEKVSVLKMDDGKVNVIGPAFLQRFGDAWGQATAGGRAVVVTGNAKAFCAGLDLKTLPGLEAPEMLAFARGFNALFRDVLAYERPVVGACDGPAMAGGAILLLSCDFRLVGPNAKVGVTEVPVGIPFPKPVADLVRARLPAPEHAPALLRGGVRAGEDLVRTGWAHEMHASERLLPRAIELAEELASFYPPAFAAAKSDAGPLIRGFDQFVKDDAQRWVDVVSSEETMMAVVEYFQRVTAKR